MCGGNCQLGKTIGLDGRAGPSWVKEYRGDGEIGRDGETGKRKENGDGGGIRDAISRKQLRQKVR